MVKSLSGPGIFGPVVTADQDDARRSVARGEHVVLVVTPEAGMLSGAWGTGMLSGDRGPSGDGGGRPGRLAVFVDDRGDPGAWAQAEAMERELFGAPGTGRP
jgi:hypothetical protein